MTGEDRQAELAPAQATPATPEPCPASAGETGTAATDHRGEDAGTVKPGTVEPGTMPPETFSICPAEIAKAATPADAPAEDEPAAALDEITGESLPLPNTPIKRRTLQAVVIPAPPGPTLARYIMSDGEKFAYFQDLSQEEKNIVLEFLLRYAPPLIARKPKRRTSPEDAPPPELPELDAEPLEKILEDAEKAEKKLENHGKA